ncbi:MAG TPA: transmembrane 220 family protein [Candidatus Sulfotelmatobacter sp.]|nr:transmembrane 220 family protein [Candidatus Sulfotelmatobacter sp.]
MILRIVNGLMTLLFAFAAYLQFNDPDPIAWTAIYAAPMVASAWAAWRPAGYPWQFPAAIALIALIWAATIAPRALGKIRLGEMFAQWEMKDAAVEENREMFGLLIVAAWMIVLVIARLFAKPA